MKVEDFTTGTTEAHRLAVHGNYGMLLKALEAEPELVNAKDKNKWTPLHEAVRGSSQAIIELLVEKGADINAEASGGLTPLDLATEFKGKDHPIVSLLRDLGAKMGPEL